MGVRVLLLFVLVALAAAACGSDSGGESASPTVAAPAFDPNKLTGMVLAPEDVNGLVGVSGLFSPGEDRDIAFVTTYGDDRLQVQSTVGYYPDPATRDQRIEKLRRALASVIKNERNYTIEGAQPAFEYRYLEGTPSSAVLAVKGEFFVMIQLFSRDGTGEAEVFNDDSLRAYVRICLDRVQQYLDDPSSITPVPGAAQYTPPDAAPAVSTPTP